MIILTSELAQFALSLCICKNSLSTTTYIKLFLFKGCKSQNWKQNRSFFLLEIFEVETHLFAIYCYVQLYAEITLVKLVLNSIIDFVVFGWTTECTLYNLCENWHGVAYVWPRSNRSRFAWKNATHVLKCSLNVPFGTRWVALNGHVSSGGPL